MLNTKSIPFQDKKRTTCLPGIVCSAGILLLMIILMICSQDMPVIVPDEVGYLAAGAAFAGFDWSGAMYISPYYGYGYGMLLSILYRLLSDSVMIYRAVILINGFLLVCIYWMSCRLLSSILPQVNGTEKYMICFLATVYPSNIYYACTANGETWLTALYLLLCLLVLRLCTGDGQAHLPAAAGAALLSVYLVACHQRSLGILAVVTLFLLFLVLAKKLPVRSLLIYAGCLLVFFFLYSAGKDGINAVLYEVSGLTETESEKITRAAQILSISGIKSFFKLMLGRAFSLGCASFLLAWWGVLAVCRDVLMTLKKWKRKLSTYDSHVLFEGFCLLCLLAEMAIGALAFLFNAIRIDGFLYGRYHEFVVIPLLLFGLAGMRSWRRNIRIQMILSVLLLGMAAALRYIYYTNQTLQTSTHSIASIIGMPIFQNYTTQNIQFLFSFGLAFFSLALAWLLFLLIYKSREVVRITVLSLFAVCWIFFAVNGLRQNVFNHSSQSAALQEFLQEAMVYLSDEESIYYVRDTESEETSATSSTWLVYRVRFLLDPDVDMQVIDLDEIAGQSYLIAFKFNEEDTCIQEQGYTLILDSDLLRLYAK